MTTAVPLMYHTENSTLPGLSSHYNHFVDDETSLEKVNILPYLQGYKEFSPSRFSFFPKNENSKNFHYIYHSRCTQCSSRRKQKYPEKVNNIAH